MATLNFVNYVKDAEGNGVSGATVQLFAMNVNGTKGSQVGSDYTTGSNGRFTFSTSHTNSPSGKFIIVITSGSDVREHWGDVSFQSEVIYGPNGEAPLPSNSVLSSHLAAGAANDAAIGGRTLNQAVSTPATPSGSLELTPALSWLAKAVKAISGETNWYTSPTAGTMLDKVRNGGNAPKLSSGVARPASGTVTNEIFVCTSGANIGVWLWNGSSWTAIATPDTGGGGSGTSNSFSRINIGGTTLIADSAEDTLNIVAGTNISIAAVAGTDTFTINASGGTSGGGTSGDATSLKGIDGNRYPYAVGYQSGSANPPVLGALPIKTQFGSTVVNPSGGGLFNGIQLTGPINGYHTIVVCDGDYDAHPTVPLILSAEVSQTGSNPFFIVRAMRSDNGSGYTTNNIRVNWVVYHW